MTVCIPATGQGLDASLDARLGRAPWLVVVDTETGHVRATENRANLEAAQGAGIQTAQRIVESGARATVVQHCGPKAFAVLLAAGVAVYTADGGTVGEAVEALKADRLTLLDSADVEGHWV